MSDFAVWYAHYPRKRGKIAAERAYRKARIVATAEELLAGIDRYIAMKPAYADWCHPATWLNQGRWMDEPDAAPPMREAWSCPHVEPCSHRAMCEHATRFNRPRRSRTA